MLSQDRLKELLEYDANTGDFVWLKITSRRVKVGDKACKSSNRGYFYISIDKKRYGAHRLAWFYEYGSFPKHNIDHIDGNPSNNKISNLREANQSQNGMNKKLHKNKNSGIKGVGWHKASKKWRARITINRIQHNLGLFDDKELAELVVMEARFIYHGEFARDK